jgi:rhamnogalacturonan endolyase
MATSTLTLKTSLLMAAAAMVLLGCGGGALSTSSATTDASTSDGSSTLTSASTSTSATTATTTTCADNAFGASAANGFITVDSGAGLVFKVKQATGDITSIRFNGGPQLQDWERYSHIASGISAPTTFEVSNCVVKLTLTTSTLIHYLLVRQGENNIYMGTYTTAEPGVGELRWITRLDSSVITGLPAASDLRDTDGAIESADVFGISATGQTRSKYYGNQRAMDLTMRGMTGSNVGVYMVYGNREGSSGGPFFDDIQSQTAELYNYMNSGHNQTEANRMGFHGPYALMFTTGAAPAIPDMSWMEDYNLNGWVKKASRGSVTGAGLTGMNPAYTYVVGFANDEAQYWATAAAGTGAFSSLNMKPGTYTMTVYKNEYELLTESVTVTAGTNTALTSRSITNDPSNTTALWRIGDWDGTPLEFLNGSRLRNMHPSDTRHASWVTPNFVVGTSTAATGFPAYQWTGINPTITIKFQLSASEIVPLTLRAGITVAFAGGRPYPTVNSWQPKSYPSASTQPDSRSMTVGSYRGNNKMYSFAIPASALVVGENTITLSPLSGSTGSGYLSPGYAFDAVDLIKTP